MSELLTAQRSKKRVDPVTESMPKDWTPEQRIIAEDAMAVLQKHYPGWLWGIEYGETINGVMGSIIVRLQDVPTEVVYLISPKDIDRDKMHCVVVAGGMLLEAHGLSRTKGRHDEVHGLKTTATGLIVPDFDAVPTVNPGYAQIKKAFNRLR